MLLNSAMVHAARHALVIGNENYADTPLKNPVNDANDVAGALKRLGFNVTKLINADEKQMFRAIRKFGKSLNKKDVGLFYYAGHGMQVKGKNYLIPIGSDIEDEDEVQFSAIDAGTVLAKMESAGNSLNIILLDACRNNPFLRSFRSSSRGLARMDAPTGSMLVYATGPSNVAADGDGRNGLFTQSLLKHIETSGASLEDVIRKTRADVVKKSNRKQVPWSSSSMIEEFYFVKENKTHNIKPIGSLGNSIDMDEKITVTASKPSLLPQGIIDLFDSISDLARNERFSEIKNYVYSIEVNGWQTVDNFEESVRRAFSAKNKFEELKYDLMYKQGEIFEPSARFYKEFDKMALNGKVTDKWLLAAVKERKNLVMFEGETTMILVFKNNKHKVLLIK